MDIFKVLFLIFPNSQLRITNTFENHFFPENNKSKNSKAIILPFFERNSFPPHQDAFWLSGGGKDKAVRKQSLNSPG